MENKKSVGADSSKKEHEKVSDSVSPKKSYAKASGVKSAFVTGDQELLFTSFGKGNAAIKEKRVDSEGEIEQLNDSEAYSLSASSDCSKFFVKNGRVKFESKTIEINRPVKGKSKSSVRINGYHEAVERRFFDNKNNPFKDNIHIQIAYNIMDMEKILAVHINNIVYSINNLFRIDYNENDDFLGYMSLNKPFDDYLKSDRAEAFNKLLGSNNSKNPRLNYYGSAFIKSINKNEVKYRSSEEIYYILCMLGEARQMLAHGKEDEKYFIYNIENYKASKFGNKPAEILDGIYKNKVDSLNKNFIRHSEKDITIILKALNCAGANADDNKKKEIIKEYYDFIVRKTNKNMGFSVVNLREYIINNCFVDNDGRRSTDNKYDSVRHKLYRAIDFVICHYYKINDEKALKLVEKLRANMDESGKNEIYAEESKLIYPSVENSIKTVASEMNGFNIQKLKGNNLDPILTKVNVKDYALNSDADYFSKFIYLLTLFIDGKEINDLLTTLINKMENIGSLLSVLEPGEYKFKDRYKMFERSNAIALDLRSINSFARMEMPSPNAKQTMFIDAIDLLGLNGSEDAQVFYKKKIEPYVFDKDGNIIDVTNERGRTSHKKNKDNIGIYNFLANNVVESSRFKYLVRYGNPKKLRLLASNETVVRFVINNLPEAQIMRYYNACTSTNRIKSPDELKAEHTDKLVSLVTNMNFNTIEGVKEGRTTPEKEKKKAIVSFYLMVLYHLTKNLVYVNSRYFMAFHCLERDFYMLYSESARKDLREKKNIINDCVLTNDHIEQEEPLIERDDLNDTKSRAKAKSKMRKWCILLRKDIDSLDRKELRTDYRNAVAHLNIPRNANDYTDGITHIDSYFSLYHYMMQNYLDRENKIPAGFVHAGNYSKDLVKALNAPFGYNLPRFKSLSVEGLFDMNNPGKDE